MSGVPTPSSSELAAAAVREAVAAVGTALFLDGQRKEACGRKAYNRDLNDLVLTAERQFLWDALRRLREYEHTGRPVMLTENQAKQVEHLDALRGSVGIADAGAAKPPTSRRNSSGVRGYRHPSEQIGRRRERRSRPIRPAESGSGTAAAMPTQASRGASA